jgi:hypothetical protein
VATTKEVFDLVGGCNEPDSEYVRWRLSNPDDELEGALATMSAEEVVQFLKDAYWNDQEAPEQFEQENAELRARAAEKIENQSDDAHAELAALLARLRK